MVCVPSGNENSHCHLVHHVHRAPVALSMLEIFATTITVLLVDEYSRHCSVCIRERKQLGRNSRKIFCRGCHNRVSNPSPDGTDHRKSRSGLKLRQECVRLALTKQSRQTPKSEVDDTSHSVAFQRGHHVNCPAAAAYALTACEPTWTCHASSCSFNTKPSHGKRETNVPDSEARRGGS